DMSILRELASALARIPKRIGLGLGPQRLFITNRGIGQEHFHDHPIDWLRALMAETKVPLLSTEPDLPLPQAVSAAISEQFASCTRPWIVLGIGASHPDKDWSDAAWIRFLAGLQTPGTVFLIGGPANARRAAAFIAATGAERTSISPRCASTIARAAFKRFTIAILTRARSAQRWRVGPIMSPASPAARKGRFCNSRLRAHENAVALP